MASQTLRTRAAIHRGTGHDMITGLHGTDFTTNGFDNTSRFMAEHGR
jgi:hypothetical protein